MLSQAFRKTCLAEVEAIGSKLSASERTEQSDTGWLEIEKVRSLYEKCLQETNIAFKQLWEKTKLVEQEMNLVTFVLEKNQDSVYDTLRESVKHDVITSLQNFYG